MSGNRMIVTGMKESFIARVLVNKVRDAGLECSFVHCGVDDINANLDGTSLITLSMGDEERPGDDVLHFLIDQMEEKDLRMILVGEKEDIEYIEKRVSEDLIYRAFERPVDNMEFIRTVSDYLKKAEEGEFKKRIMIVDDDTRYLKLVREWLKEDYKVYMANSGFQAIKLLGKNKVDLILLDHEMPVTSGPQVLEMLRNDPDTRSIPVMFLTGKGDKESVMAVVALKPEGYFLKTIRKDELLENLKEYFALH